MIQLQRMKFNDNFLNVADKQKDRRNRLFAHIRSQHHIVQRILYWYMCNVNWKYDPIKQSNNFIMSFDETKSLLLHFCLNFGILCLTLWFRGNCKSSLFHIACLISEIVEIFREQSDEKFSRCKVTQKKQHRTVITSTNLL